MGCIANAATLKSRYNVSICTRGSVCSLQGSCTHASVESREALSRKQGKAQDGCEGGVSVPRVRFPAQGLSSLADLCPGCETAE